MASRFSWFLFPLLALLFCHGAFLDAIPPETDILLLQDIKGMGCPANNKANQYAVLYLTGKNLRLPCHQIGYDDPGNVSAICNFSPVFFNKNLKKSEETFRHSEWQLIHTALRPMLQKWQAANKNNPTNDNCPESLYLYSYNAPDYLMNRRQLNHTCTQAIVTKIPSILNEEGCNETRIVVGFSEVKFAYLKEACDGYKLMEENNIKAYHLESTDEQKKLNCSGVTPNAG